MLLFAETKDLAACAAVRIDDPYVVLEHPRGMAGHGEQDRTGFGCGPQTFRGRDDPLHGQLGVDRVVTREVGQIGRAARELGEVAEDLLLRLKRHAGQPEAPVLVAGYAGLDLGDVVVAGVGLVGAG